MGYTFLEEGAIPVNHSMCRVVTDETLYLMKETQSDYLNRIVCTVELLQDK